jgi:hypothetical protein
VAVTLLGDDTATMVMDATRARFHAPVGDQSTATGAKRGIGGPSHLLEHLGQLTTSPPALTTRPANPVRPNVHWSRYGMGVC